MSRTRPSLPTFFLAACCLVGAAPSWAGPAAAPSRGGHAIAQGTNAVDAREALRREVEGLVAAGRFDRLSAMVARDVAAGVRLPDGLWRSSLANAYFESALSKRLTTDMAWARTLAVLFKRAQVRPADALLLVQALSAQAWQVRGPRFSSHVPAQAMERFHQILGQARDELEARKVALAGNPLWHSLRITVALELGEDEAFQDRLFTEAARMHPRYHAIYFARLRHLYPRWGGSEARIMQLLREVAAMPAEVADEGMYARLVWVLDGEHEEMLHTQTFDAKAMGSAMRAIVAGYPDQWNLQKMFYMACERSDKALAAELLPKLASPPIQAVIPEDARDLYLMCQEWAAGTLPMFMMREHYPGGVVHERMVQ